jgi:hypothetical protein
MISICFNREKKKYSELGSRMHYPIFILNKKIEKSPRAKP